MNRATEVNLLAPWASHLPSDWGRCRLDAVADVFERSVNVSSPHSDLRIQLQTDPRYQEFIPRAELKEVLGYKMVVAKLEDVLQGKVWAYMDQTRRRSKRQKDLADILRIIEAYPQLGTKLPQSLRKELEKD